MLLIDWIIAARHPPIVDEVGRGAAGYFAHNPDVEIFAGKVRHYSIVIGFVLGGGLGLVLGNKRNQEPNRLSDSRNES